MAGSAAHKFPSLFGCLSAAWLLVAGLAIRSEVRADTDVQTANERDPIKISARFAQEWVEDAETIQVLRGDCRLIQGANSLRANQVVLWRVTDGAPGQVRERVIAYLEEDVRVEQPGSTLTERSLLVELITRGGVGYDVGRRVTEPAGEDAFYQRALRRRKQRRNIGKIHQVQFAPSAAEPPSDADPELQSIQLQTPPTGLRRIRVFPRSAVRFNVESFESNNTFPPEQVWIISGGVNLLVDGVEQLEGTVDLSADRMVIFTQLNSGSDLTGEGTVQTRDTPLQVYLEGNILIRQGTNVLRATQAVYDAREDRALLLNAELKTRLPTFRGNIRVRADQIRQLGQNHFQAHKAWVSTSEFGKPGYRIQVSDAFIEPRQDNPWAAGGNPPLDGETGQPLPSNRMWSTTLDNTFLIGDVPLFYVPYLSVPMEDVNIPLRTVAFGNDRVFGTQVRSTWDVFKLLQLLPADGPLSPFRRDPPPNVRWDFLANYYSKRGPLFGTSGSYGNSSPTAERFGLTGPYKGYFITDYLHDKGTDNLGADRRDILTQQQSRGRFLLRDRQEFQNHFTLLLEGAWLSDRNYLEEYDLREYNTGKDYETLGYLKYQKHNYAWSLLGRPRPYNYFQETAWLPRFDFYDIGEPLFDGAIVGSGHTYTGYANTNVAAFPNDPNDKFSVLPWEFNGSGLVLGKRCEFSAPLNLGPLNIAPYVMGDFSHWGDTPSGKAIDRIYGSVGARGSIEFSRIFPDVQSTIFNLNGLAHKMVFDGDYYMASSNQPLSAIPQYNDFDDNSQEQFRRRFFYNTFNATTPPQFDPRFYAVRSGAEHNITGQADELVDTQNVMRMGWRHRLQTRVGPASNQRIKNWMTLDLETSFFPNPNRDNFGKNFGLYGGRYNWFVGDRTTLNASSYFDTFTGAPNVWSLGMITQRAARGSLYVGLRNIEVPTLRSQILTFSYSYTHSPKWISTLGTSYDLGLKRNLGESVTLTRVGADFLIHVGVLIDPNRNNVGAAVSIEPRFGPSVGNNGPQLSSLLQGTQTR